MNTCVFLVIMTTYSIVDYLNEVVDRVRDSFKRAVLGFELFIWPDIVAPSMKCFNWSRRQYLAPCIIDQLRSIVRERQGSNSYAIGVGYVDGYDTGLNFVFGEADIANGVAVVFTRRLDQRFYGLEPDYDLYVERVSKEVVHELGHLMNLKHCSSRECVMSFSNSVIEVDVKTRFFCNKCISFLKNNSLYSLNI